MKYRRDWGERLKALSAANQEIRFKFVHLFWTAIGSIAVSGLISLSAWYAYFN